MERLKNMELKKTFLVLSASCVLVALLMLGLVFMICNSISSNFPSGGIEILADGSIVKMETPTETQQNILSMLGIIQIVSCIVLPMGGLALSGILYYHIKLKQPISTLRNGISRIRNHDLDFSMPVHSDDELGQLCTAFDTMREELLKSNQELWRQAEERKRLNAAFSHDLRNPITVLKGTIKLLRQGTADEQAIDRLESYTLRIEQYAEAMEKDGENACYHHSRQPHCKNGRPAICNCGRCSFGGDSKMKSYLALAWKELKAQKITAILILVAVIMSTIMTTVIGQSIGILQSMRIQQAAGLNGNRYATFHQLGKEQAQKLHEDDRLYDVGDTIFIGSTPLGNSSLSLYLREYHDNALSMYPAIGNVKEGRLPEEAIEIALSEDALQYLGLDAVIGDTVSLDLSVSVMDGSLSELEYSADFVLTGILESSYIGYASGTVEGIVGEGTAEELLPEEYLLYSTDFKTYDKQNFQSIIYALAEDLNVDERYIQYNWVLLDAIGISYDEAADSDTGTGFSFMTAACILVGVLVLLAAGLVIYNILKISITKRIKEYGTLRAIGGERGQIYRLVSLQLLILCGAGIPIGLLLGILSAKGVLIAATGLLNPDLFMANSTSELNSAINTASTVKLPMLFASIAVILLFALLAAFPAARYASHVSPTVAMSGQTVKIKRRIKRNRNIRNFEAYYARLNLKRGRGRTAVTILSLVMSITVFVALQSFTGLLDASSSVQDMYFSDYAVTNETVGIPSEAVKTLAENDAVESVSTTRLSVFMPGAGDILPFETDLSVQSHETLQLVNVDEAQLQIYAPNLSAQDKQALKDGTGCLVKNPIAFSYGDTTVQQTDLTVGDTIQLGDRTLPVLGLIDTAITINNDGFTNGVQLIVNDEIYCSLLGNDSYSEVYPTLQDNADTDTFESWLDSWCSNYPGTHWLSYLQSSNEMIESFEQIKMLCWVLIIFIGIIGILNIINTVYSNIHTRVGEIGMQRAIGMSAASLYKTFLWEGAYYGIIASVIGAVFGYVCCIFVGAAQTDALQLVAVPVMAIVEAAIISIVACLLATAIPLRSIARMSIVDSIETVE